MPSPDRQVLIIDDEPSWVEVLSRELKKQNYQTTVAYDAASGRKAVVEDGFDGIVLLDLRLPDADGMDLIEPLLAARPGLRIIMMTAHGTAADEDQARQRGVHLFVSKSEGKSRIIGAVESAMALLKQASELEHYREILGERYRFEGILTRSPKMKKLFEMLEHVVDSKVSVLLQGESGTGKELVARALHYEGPRRNGPFIAVNCGGIPETLLESELFGHERGAFTGAVALKKGKFELADGGTLFLDEIGEMPLHLQVKLLRVLQERQVERIGGTAPRSIDVRIVSATHRDLMEMVREKRFREDLYYRLAVFPVYLPPLREREGDIGLLAQHFLEKAVREEGKGPRAISSAALTALEAYPFPGNVRELENIINRAVLVATNEVIVPRDLPLGVLETFRPEDRVAPQAGPQPERGLAELDDVNRLVGQINAARALPRVGLDQAFDVLFGSLADLPSADLVEQALIERALKLADGNVAEAAKALGMSRATIYRRIRKEPVKGEAETA
ncbi:MAG: sigma-54-dependent Fis family transcriptional regulator [Deltaproteobacteria bacterium]|nr:sigma-54-dependent Fis family transcriptional regulator [Deltaproteobacteria bacterium]